MRLLWTPEAWDDYVWLQSQEPEAVAKINELLKDIRRNPFSGLGKPEPLKGEFSGWWSRRITKSHRLIYRVAGKRGEDQHVVVTQCRFHY